MLSEVAARIVPERSAESSSAARSSSPGPEVPSPREPAFKRLASSAPDDLRQALNKKGPLKHCFVKWPCRIFGIVTLKPPKSMSSLPDFYRSVFRKSFPLRTIPLLFKRPLKKLKGQSGAPCCPSLL